ncbi:MAG: pimeloyl-ACP methyl ester esterase BioH [Methylophilaceae bacterium]|nr:pimeloyl-ACP methyl ester esterase BioH [Methylophilaceae bacterium]
MSAHVEIIGTGSAPNLVLIHGWGMSSAVFAPLIKPLSKIFTLHLVDLPGMGASRPIEPFNLHALADTVGENIPGKANVLGWSLGGLVAQRIAILQPDRIRRLVLVGSTPCFVNHAGWQYGVNPAAFDDFARGVNENYQATILQFLTLQCMGASDARSTVRQLRTALANKPAPTQATLQGALKVLLDSDLRDEVANIRKPTLLIHGDRDTLAPLQAAHWMSQNLPLGFLRVIAGASHAPFLSHQTQFIAALTQFLEPEQQ